MLISLEETLAFPELKCAHFVLSGECFASGNIYQTYEILKLIFEVWIVCLIFYQDKSLLPVMRDPGSIPRGVHVKPGFSC
jgi:hypothetical protein